MKLNEQQRAVVESPLENSLVLAGAGTGKTSVLVERIAYLIGSHKVFANNILAITFTRKAASEIRHRCILRLEDFYESDPSYANVLASSITMGTFHSVFTNILRYNIRFSETDLKPNFTIASDSVTSTYVKQIVAEKGYKEDFEGFGCKLEDLFASLKENLVRLDTFDYDTYVRFLTEFFRIDGESYSSTDRFFTRSYYDKVLSIFQSYEQRLRNNNQLDFSDLLVQSYWLLFNNPKALARLQRRYKYMLVDECQDMNLVQYKLIELLHNKNFNNVTIIGDDDQSIYGFRGACVELIDYFVEKFDDVKVYKLEQNYRCSPNIIALANKVINKNKTHNIKTLIASKPHSDNRKVYYHLKYRQEDEYKDIVESLRKHQDYGSSAILARSNQSLVGIENLLIQNRIPYTKSSGIKFFNRLEVKILFGYLRLVINPDDNDAFLELANAKSLIAGFGPKKIEILEDYATNRGLPYLKALEQGLGSKLFPPKLTAELNQLLERLEYFKQFVFGNFSDLISEVIDHCNLLEYFQNSGDKRVDPQKRLKVIKDIIALVERMEKQYDDPVELNIPAELYELTIAELKAQHPEQTEDEVKRFYFAQNFLSNYLISEESPDNASTEDNDDDNKVLLSTIHGVKGLEFNHVYIVDFDEETMPSFRSKTIAELAEERRLLYVAITRAKETLDIYFAHTRVIYGRWSQVDLSFYSNDICSRDLIDSVKIIGNQNLRLQDLEDPEELARESCPAFAQAKNSLTHIQLKEHEKLVPPQFEGTEEDLHQDLRSYESGKYIQTNYFTQEYDPFEQANSNSFARETTSFTGNETSPTISEPDDFVRLDPNVDVFDLLTEDPNDPYSGNFQIDPNLVMKQQADVEVFEQQQDIYPDFSNLGDVFSATTNASGNEATGFFDNEFGVGTNSSKPSKLNRFVQQSAEQRQQQLYSKANSFVETPLTEMVDEIIADVDSFKATTNTKTDTKTSDQGQASTLDVNAYSTSDNSALTLDPSRSPHLAETIAAKNLDTQDLAVFSSNTIDDTTRHYYSSQRPYLKNLLIRKLQKFVGKHGLNIPTITNTAIEYLVDSELVCDYFEIFILPMQVWLSVPTIDQTNIEQLNYELYRAHYVEPAVLIYALDYKYTLDIVVVKRLMSIFKTIKKAIKYIKLMDTPDEFYDMFKDTLFGEESAHALRGDVVKFYELLSNKFTQAQLYKLLKINIPNQDEKPLSFNDFIAKMGGLDSHGSSTASVRPKTSVSISASFSLDDVYQHIAKTAQTFEQEHNVDTSFSDDISFIPKAKPKDKPKTKAKIKLKLKAQEPSVDVDSVNSTKQASDLTVTSDSSTVMTETESKSENLTPQQLKEQEEASKLLQQSLTKSAQMFDQLSKKLPSKRVSSRNHKLNADNFNSSDDLTDSIDASLDSSSMEPSLNKAKATALSKSKASSKDSSLVLDTNNAFAITSLSDMNKDELLTYLKHKTIMIVGYHDFLQTAEIVDCLTELDLKVQFAPNFRGVDVVFVLSLTPDARQELATITRYNKNVIQCSNSELSCLLD